MGSDTLVNATATENHASSNGNVDTNQGMYRIISNDNDSEELLSFVCVSR